MALPKTVVGLMVVSVAVAGLAFSSSFAEGAWRGAAKEAASAPAAKANVVRVTGEDFKFDAPDAIPAGLTEFRFLNKGPAIHHMALLHLADGKTMDDLRAALANPGPRPSWMHELGGANAPDPGTESNVTMTLEPGNYALICFVHIGGPPHFMKGMLKGLRVTPTTAAAAPAPYADATISLVDYNFKLSSQIRAGTRIIRVQNDGGQHHEVELVKLAPGVNVADFMKWIEKMEGPPAGIALGGVSGMLPGTTQYFTANFTPGNYALICFLPDTKDGKPHFAHGMIQEITVN